MTRFKAESNMPTIDDYLSGTAVYGNDFSVEEIAQWFRDEEHGYYSLLQSCERYEYAYHALNWHHAWRHLSGRHFRTCLAFGCANGDDVQPLAPQVGEFIAVEPARNFWRAEIGGVPARFVAPSASGDIPLSTGRVDLAVCLHALHHIPNVSHVLDELHRVLAPNGLLVLAEPISTMGDWRKPRRGLTKHERGLPLSYLHSHLQNLGFEIVREARCQFPLTTRLARLFRINCAYNSKILVRLDYLMSRLTAWNYHYHRNTVYKKISPGSTFIIARKRR